MSSVTFAGEDVRELAVYKSPTASVSKGGHAFSKSRTSQRAHIPELSRFLIDRTQVSQPLRTDADGKQSLARVLPTALPNFSEWSYLEVL